MKITAAAFAALVASVSSTAIDLEKRDSPLSVSLTQVEDSKVKVSLTNNNEASYKLFYKGTFLDEAPTDKLSVSSDCKSRIEVINIVTKLTQRSFQGHFPRHAPAHGHQLSDRGRFQDHCRWRDH
jgi:hypothetical protein